MSSTPSSSAQLQAQDYRDQIQHQEQRQQSAFGSSLIQSNSIQTQFTTLSNQRDNFIREREVAERELKQLQGDHQSIKMEHVAIIESNRRAKEDLGQKMEKLAMLKEEESRLSRLTENESNAIHDCTKHLKVLEKKRCDESKRHTAEMEPLNFELAALLERRIEKKTKRCITVRSIEKVIIPEFDRAMVDKNKPQLLNKRDSLYESMELLKSASEQRKNYISILSDLARAQQQQRNVEIRAGNSAIGNDKSIGPNHVDLFYGTSRN